MPITTTQMGLPVALLDDPSPAHVAAVAASLAILDAHNHAASGSRVPTAALSIDAALPFGGNSAQKLRSLQLQPQDPPLDGSAEADSAFVGSDGEFYYTDGSGQLVRITNGGKLDAGGPLKGDYVASGAVASYNQVAKQYTFFDEFNAKAAVQAGEILCSGVGGFGNTAPAIGAAGVSLLPANTAATNVMLSCKGDLRAQGGFRHTALTCYLQLAASIGDFLMRGAGGSFGTALWTAPRSGSVTGVSYYYSANQTAGALSFKVRKNGAGLVTTPSFTSGQAGSATWAKDANTFATGDRLDLVVTTDGSFSPATNFVVAYVHVEY
jgi:hypothetical protein